MALRPVPVVDIDHYVCSERFMTPAPATADELGRLAFIKYVFSLALTQAKQPEPLSNVALLLLHDSIEAFLQLACARLGLKVGDDKFMPLCGAVDAKLREQSEVLPEIGRMPALNSARGALKHKGVFPSARELERHVQMAIRFFDQASPMIFAVSFDRISMADLVTCGPARDELKRAEQALEADDVGGGLLACALAL